MKYTAKQVVGGLSKKMGWADEVCELKESGDKICLTKTLKVKTSGHRKNENMENNSSIKEVDEVSPDVRETKLGVPVFRKSSLRPFSERRHAQ